MSEIFTGPQPCRLTSTASARQKTGAIQAANPLACGRIEGAPMLNRGIGAGLRRRSGAWPAGGLGRALAVSQALGFEVQDGIINPGLAVGRELFHDLRRRA